MKNVLAAAAALQRFCSGHAWRFCFIGGLAVQRWSRPRFTDDADMTLLADLGREEEYVDLLLSEYRARFASEREFALRARVVRLFAPNDIPLDIALGALDFEHRSIARATPWKAQRLIEPLLTCSAEDLIVHKAFAARDQDWIDLEGVIIRQTPRLNVEQIWSELKPLVELKEEPQILTKLQRIFDQHLE